MPRQKNAFKYTIGVDEAGRGPIAGPVAVGAVCVSAEKIDKVREVFQGLRDSKQHTAKEREVWFQKMLTEEKKGSLDLSVCMSHAKTIDEKGIVRAIRTALDRALENVNRGRESEPNTLVLLDGALQAPEKYQNQKTIIKGDEKELVIALASIVAKVTRDRKMVKMAKKYPEYGFEKHKGYGTAHHLAKIREFGFCDIHRRTFLKNLI